MYVLELFSCINKIFDVQPCYSNVTYMWNTSSAVRREGWINLFKFFQRQLCHNFCRGTATDRLLLAFRSMPLPSRRIFDNSRWLKMNESMYLFDCRIFHARFISVLTSLFSRQYSKATKVPCEDRRHERQLRGRMHVPLGTMDTWKDANIWSQKSQMSSILWLWQYDSGRNKL